MDQCSVLMTNNTFLAPSSHQRGKIYQKLSLAVKKELAELVYHHNLTIKKASKQLNISYSSAKIILNKFKIKQRLFFLEEMKASIQVDFKEISFKEAAPSDNPITLVSLVGGKYQSQNSNLKQFNSNQFM